MYVGSDTMEYNLRDDVKMVMELLDLQINDIAAIMGVEPITINRLLKNIIIAKENMERLYSYVYRKKIHLNLIKSTLYEEEGENYSKVLYHGAKDKIIGPISLDKGRINNDFGKAFYAAEGYIQAASFVSSRSDSRVYVLDLNIYDLNGLELGVNLEWMIMIAYFRGRLEKYKNHPYILKLLDNLKDVDYIKAPIADNRMFMIIDTFISGEITDMQCRHALAYANLGNQYVLISDKAIKALRIIDTLYLCEDEKSYYLNKRLEDSSISNDKVKMARIKYKNQGLYIDEVLK